MKRTWRIGLNSSTSHLRRHLVPSVASKMATSPLSFPACEARRIRLGCRREGKEDRQGGREGGEAGGKGRRRVGEDLREKD